MATPVGHSLVGAGRTSAASRARPLIKHRLPAQTGPLTVGSVPWLLPGCLALANLPDVDLLLDMFNPRHPPAPRGPLGVAV